MNASSRKRRILYGEAPPEKHVTIADERVASLIEQQLCTQITLEGELQQTNKFTSGVLIKDGSSSLTGQKSLTEFQGIQAKEQQKIELREAGLSEDDIALKLLSGSLVETLTHSKKKRLLSIDKKIEEHEKQLSRPVSFSGIISVSRKEFELDHATYQGKHDTDFSHLIRCKIKSFPANDPVIAALEEYNQDQADECDAKFVGPVLPPINERVEPIPEQLIIKNRISLCEIHAMERFKDYKSGPSSNVIYIKNLAKTTTVKDLARLFVRFCFEHESDVTYKLMSGRMHGQAFVTFKVEKSAIEALLLCNGYMLNGKPMIIAYAKNKLAT